MTWVLIFLNIGYQVTTTIEFNSKENCLAVKEWIMVKTKNQLGPGRVECFPK